MDRDSLIHEVLVSERRFIRSGEIKKRLPHLSDQQLDRTLKRLERHGLLVRSVGYYKNRPVNTYLGLDPSDPDFHAEIVSDHGWVFAIFHWHGSLSVSLHLGEAIDYLVSTPKGDALDYGRWADTLYDAGRLTFEEFKFPTNSSGVKKEG